MQQKLIYPEANKDVNTYVMGLCLRADSIFAKRFIRATPESYLAYLDFKCASMLNLSLGMTFNISHNGKTVYVKVTDNDVNIEQSYVVAIKPGTDIERQVVFYGAEPKEDVQLCLITK